MITRRVTLVSRLWHVPYISIPWHFGDLWCIQRWLENKANTAGKADGKIADVPAEMTNRKLWNITML